MIYLQNSSECAPQRSADSCFNNHIGIRVEWSGIELRELAGNIVPGISGFTKLHIIFKGQ